MKLSFKILTLILLSSILSIGCNDDNENVQQTETEPEPELITYLCCGENPFENQNIDNLDQSSGVINIVPVFTPNGDGILDVFTINNIGLYSNNLVTIYNLNNEIIFSTGNYNNGSNSYGWSNGNNDFESGTYKYKIVIENEQTYLQYGYVCLVKTPEDRAGIYFYNECLDHDNNNGPDPILI
ncbi:MAG: gliding motility-associated C-terminal domain-containing protein [Flavobacteriaceae bacterium]|nr:gliding motility-associated C-terminal domain-containing protein [Flavobacteriaceae bacterium]